MLGKRPRPTMRRTSSVSLIGSGCVNGDSSSPLPEHPKEKLKSCCASPSAPRQVIGFHPKPNTFLDDDLLDLSPAPARRSSPPPQQQQQGSSRSPSGSPRSGLGDLLAAGARPWERKDEGVGLGIVAALSASQEEVCKVRDEGQNRGFAVPPVYAPVPPPAPPARKTSPPPTSLFAPSRASPPIAIHPPSVSNSGYHPCPSHCTHQNCDAVAAFGLMPPTTGRPEPMFGGGGVGARPNSSSSSSSSTVTWTRPSNSNGGGAAAAALIWGQQQQQADMEVDRCEPLVLPVSPLAHVARHSISASSAAFSQNFLDACHLCRRRLGEGRDIYIYRGDRAFCSPECRHQQILNDERTEKCSSAVMKMGGSDARSTTQRNRVMAAGTAAAA